MKKTVPKRVRHGRGMRTGGFRLAEPTTPVIRYVNALLYQMSQGNTRVRVLRQSEALPTISEFGEPMLPPSHDAVLNRFKAMVGLSPVTYPQPVESSLTVQVARREFHVHCRFNDNADERCTITMHETGDA